MTKKQRDKELPLDVAPRWTVDPVFFSQTKEEKAAEKAAVVKHYELRWDGFALDKAKGEFGIERLRYIAKLGNARQLQPRFGNQCIADLSAHPIKPLKRSERSPKPPAEEDPKPKPDPMKLRATFCDLCKADGDLVPAVCRYNGGTGWFDACDVHQEEVERFGFPTVPFDFTGDVDPDDFT